MAVTSLVSYQDFCRKYVPEQYKQSPKLLGLIDACLDQCNDLEAAFFELMDALNLETAIGPALDYIGAIVGVARVPGETDDHYRGRIKSWRRISGLPSLEALRAVLLFVSGCDRVGLYPDWPAGMYFVLNGSTPADLSDVERYMTSGCNLTRGTFLIGEFVGALDHSDVEFGYLVLEDNGQPLVCDYDRLVDPQPYDPDNIPANSMGKVPMDSVTYENSLESFAENPIEVVTDNVTYENSLESFAENPIEVVTDNVTYENEIVSFTEEDP